jgi:single-stranded-DNA-specific exonuclease
MQHTNWKGLTALKEICGIQDKVESQHLGFKIGPRINAAGRVGSAFDALSLLLTDDKDEAIAMAVGLDTSNIQRKTIELDITGKACKIIDETFNPKTDFGIVVAGQDWHTGVVGIVASRLVDRYERPAIALSIFPDGIVKGSCRTIEQFDILKGLTACADLLVKFGGHKNSAGLELRVENLQEFKNRFCEYCKQELQGKDLAQSLKICSEIKPSDWGWELYNQIQTLQPFGNKNPEPVWSITDAMVVDARMMKDVHLKLTISKGTAQMSGIMFNYTGNPIIIGTLVDVAFKMSKNVWNDVASLQMQIIDVM